MENPVPKLPVECNQEGLVAIMAYYLRGFYSKGDASTILGAVFDGKSAVHWENFVCYTILRRYPECPDLTGWPPLEDWIEMTI
jgi:hypothetical protein